MRRHNGPLKRRDRQPSRLDTRGPLGLRHQGDTLELFFLTFWLRTYTTFNCKSDTGTLGDSACNRSVILRKYMDTSKPYTVLSTIG